MKTNTSKTRIFVYLGIGIFLYAYNYSWEYLKGYKGFNASGKTKKIYVHHAFGNSLKEVEEILGSKLKKHWGFFGLKIKGEDIPGFTERINRILALGKGNSKVYYARDVIFKDLQGYSPDSKMDLMVFFFKNEKLSFLEGYAEKENRQSAEKTAGGAWSFSQDPKLSEKIPTEKLFTYKFIDHKYFHSYELKNIPEIFPFYFGQIFTGKAISLNEVNGALGGVDLKRIDGSGQGLIGEVTAKKVSNTKAGVKVTLFDAFEVDFFQKKAEAIDLDLFETLKIFNAFQAPNDYKPTVNREKSGLKRIWPSGYDLAEKFQLTLEGTLPNLKKKEKISICSNWSRIGCQTFYVQPDSSNRWEWSIELPKESQSNLNVKIYRVHNKEIFERDYFTYVYYLPGKEEKEKLGSLFGEGIENIQTNWGYGEILKTPALKGKRYPSELNKLKIQDPSIGSIYFIDNFPLGPLKFTAGLVFIKQKLALIELFTRGENIKNSAITDVLNILANADMNHANGRRESFKDEKGNSYIGNAEFDSFSINSKFHLRKKPNKFEIRIVTYAKPYLPALYKIFEGETGLFPTPDKANYYEKVK